MPTNFYASMHPPCRLVALPSVDWTSHAHLAMAMSEAMIPYAASAMFLIDAYVTANAVLAITTSLGLGTYYLTV
ncbi:hypothetical protein H257_06930 [Aphanomyces astaci]|uniref:SSD domain-containing protein n=1 Tax=Aphanomyces astaci TaxID=112090 RepID=W4GJ09_APHAT|nr:hypothetical protein H257_06930 [Aphanomyces astaci]ETV79680.1 hypothetical protein H257_06930 [Aphanomyces astaci]|eukprot:XP_009830616.1 hypothetical protein H257_06930 [Aphanomyces astaci]